MYDYIKGIIISKQPSSSKGALLVIENGGIGYAVNTTGRTISNLAEINEEAKIYVTLIHKEDAMSLCGFANREERDIFNILQSVSGVGVKSALVLLNEFSGCELISAVIRGDYKELSRAKGIGPKLAQKIIIELKDKLINWQKTAPIDLSDIAPDVNASDETVSEVQAVLFSLGYSPDEAKKAIKLAFSSTEKKDSPEEILKEALRFLAQGELE